MAVIDSEGFTTWSSWSGCSRTCGDGIRYHRRQCTLSNGCVETCVGDISEVEDCNLSPCSETGKILEASYTVGDSFKKHFTTVRIWRKLKFSPWKKKTEFQGILRIWRWFMKLSHSAVTVPHHCRPLYNYIIQQEPDHGRWL